MKQVAGKLRLDLAQYRELAAFAQFGTELDRATRVQLDRGVRITEVLKQPQYQPMAMYQQVIAIFAVTNGHMDHTPVAKVSAFESSLLQYLDSAHPDIGKAIANQGALSDETAAQLRSAIEEFKKTFTF
jgi:F-type H+-transporting ATPase subunit alpha